MNNTEPTNLFYRIINVLSKLITHKNPPNTYFNTYDSDDITNEEGVDDYKLEIADDCNNLEKKEESNKLVDNQEIELDNKVVDNQEIELENEVVTNYNDLEFQEDAEIKAILDSIIDKINNDYLNHNTYNHNINKTPVRDNVNCNWFEYYSIDNTQNYNCLECGGNELKLNLSS